MAMLLMQSGTNALRHTSDDNMVLVAIAVALAVCPINTIDHALHCKSSGMRGSNDKAVLGPYCTCCCSLSRVQMWIWEALGLVAREQCRLCQGTVLSKEGLVVRTIDGMDGCG